MPWAFAFGAIAAEIVATLALRAARGELRWGLIAVVVVGYALAFVLLCRALRTLNVGVVYAVWSGVGGMPGGTATLRSATSPAATISDSAI